MIRRRSLLAAGAAGATIGTGVASTGRLATPALAQGEAARALRFIPHANLAAVDPTEQRRLAMEELQTQAFASVPFFWGVSKT